MREDLERLEDRLREANEQVVRAKEAAVASKARGYRQEREGRNNRRYERVEELNEALGLSNVEEARLYTLGVELPDQVAALHNEKEQNLISWARDR
jgi:predicted flap endonuclease-1-like 5' DNA nuclease